MSSRRGSAACARCSRSTRAAHGSGGRCTAAAWVSWAWAGGRSSCSPRCSTPTRPTTWRRAPTTRTTRRAACRPARWRRAPRRPASAGRHKRAPGAWAARREELAHGFGLRAERARDPLGARELKNLAPLAHQRAQVGQRPQVPQLVRVDDRAHALDLPLSDVEGHHTDQPALAVEEQRTWLPVYLLAARGDAEAGEGAQPRDQRARRLGAAVDRTCEGGSLAAAVGAEHHVVGQQLLQPLEVAFLGGREEAARKLLPLLARGLEPGAPLLHLAARPCGELAGVLLARPDDLRDPVVGLVEHLAQQERGALLGRQALEQDEEGVDSESAISALRAGSSSALATSGS